MVWSKVSYFCYFEIYLSNKVRNTCADMTQNVDQEFTISTVLFLNYLYAFLPNFFEGVIRSFHMHTLFVTNIVNS